ncbi:amidohydrolase family protein [Mycolicibacterium phlei]|jgi:predicted TIM-barrel fold metal-dependent hydrolase|uniref:amidohydrolase family protein n=1 Tax=Mycolicibacterium phlei TaxID=1771 RepID=UPI00025AE2A2|nr:amidohydrolase family protein [Mycolicibacterium phlei]EID08914.1 putative TIM-barrel fold metal-dependent hydrolase [Mycolicibacterium phlei RIVM601174]MBF4193290.1 putative TIM-barrel fold metal-dependent hydrolase [Mycolicibacterium phlei]
MTVIDASVQPHFRYNAEIRRYLAEPHKLRAIPDVESQWYQAPGGDYRADLYAHGYPGSDPETVAAHLFDEAGVDIAILNPLTRGNIADYLLNSRICAAVNDWLLDRWLEPDRTGRFRGTIRVNPEDVRGAVAEIERLAAHPRMVQIGVPLQSREPYGKPVFGPIWEAAAAHGLPVVVHINGGNGVDYPPTFAGHAHTYPGYASFMPLNGFVHLATLIIEGTFGRHPGLRFVFADGGYDILTPLMWRLDTFWMSMRDQTPWVDRYPSEYLRDHVRFCSSAFDGPTDAALTERWMDFTDKADLVMYGSHYPHWSSTPPAEVARGLNEIQREKVLWRNAGALYGLTNEVAV